MKSSVGPRKPNRPLTGPKAFLKRVIAQEDLSDRSRAEVSASALRNNYRVIQSRVPQQEMLPMIKANAYGHGAEWAARALCEENQIYAFGVATLQEGAEIRAALPVRRKGIPILIFSETSPWSAAKGQFCERHGLSVVISQEEDWTRFLKEGWTSRIPYEFQFDVGMNRLGLSFSAIRKLIQDLKRKDQSEYPKGIFSHLAMSESPESKLTQHQVERFKAIRKECSGAFSSCRFHLANSGGIWNAKKYGLDRLTDVVRPGISLFGVPPWAGAPSHGLVGVLKFQARVVGIHRLRPGDSIGYGGTFQVKGKDVVYAAILGAGYADGVLRSLSNQGSAELDGRMTRLIGIVSMDYCAAQCWENTEVGSWALLLGGNVDPWQQAKAAGTIPYELFTSISNRVKRVYS